MDNTRGQLTTNHPIPFLMTLASDHVTGATGLTPKVTISKDGSAVFATASGAVVEMASGLYAWQGSAWDRDTLGSLSMIATAAGVDTSYKEIAIIPDDPFNNFGNNIFDLGAGVETGWTLRQLNRELLAGQVGNVGLSGVVVGASGTVIIKNPAGTKTRIVALCDASGSRTVTSFDVT